jgi:hypothetical protein
MKESIPCLSPSYIARQNDHGVILLTQRKIWADFTNCALDEVSRGRERLAAAQKLTLLTRLWSPKAYHPTIAVMSTHVLYRVLCSEASMKYCLKSPASPTNNH